MTDNLPFYSSKDAAEMLGVSIVTVHRLLASGKLSSSGKMGNNHIFSPEDIELCRSLYFKGGLSHTDIAKIYGKSREAVAYYFIKRLKVKPAGKDNKRRGAFIYSPSTVEKMAELLKWEPVTQENRTGE